jgi:exopolysaccharide production protein ExoQ
MSSLIATFVYVFGICVLFWLERDPGYRPSPALWLAVASLLISGSRPLTSWVQSQQQVSMEQYTEASPVDAIVALVLIVAGGVVLAGRSGQIARFIRANPTVVLFVFYCALSVFWSDYPGITFKRWIRLLGDFMPILIVLTNRDPARAIKWVLIRVAFIVLPVSILLIKYYPGLSRYYDTWTGMGYVSGVSTDKNMLGALCLVYGAAVLFCFVGLWHQRNSRIRNRRLVAYGVVLAMLFWLFSLAHSMTALSCFCFASFLIVITGTFKIARKLSIVHLLVTGIIGTAFSVLFLHIGEDAALAQLGRNSTLTGRTDIWSGLLQFAGNPLVGTGYETFWLGERMTRIWQSGGILLGINEAHNGYLEVYLNLGWIGVALLAALIVTGYRNVLATLRHDFDAATLKLAFFVLAIVYSFTEAGFRAGSPVWFAFFFAIFAVPAAPILRHSRWQNKDRLKESEPKLVTVASH